MSRKKLNLVLLGALILFIGAFASCKDYDDDIDKLQGQIDGIESKFTELNNKFGALAYVNSVSIVDGKLVVVDQGGKSSSYEIPVAPNANTTYKLDIKQEGNKVTITLTDNNGNVQTKTLDFIANESFDPTKLTIADDGSIKYGDKNTGAKLPQSSAVSITEIKEGDVIVGYAITVDGKTTNLMISDALPLTSISFEPDVLLEGVPSMKALSVVYKPWSVKTECNPATEKGAIWLKGTKDAFISPVIAGKYLLNPSSVTADQIKSIDVLSRDIEYVRTRSADSKPAVESYEVKDGVLTVYFTATTELINSLEDNDLLTGLKIKVNTIGKETIIDQDYRGIYTTRYSNLILADKKKKEIDRIVEHHLYGAKTGLAEDAIKQAPDYTVVFNSSTGLDLKPLVITCYDDIAGSTTKPELTMSNDELKSLGLKYEFHLCAYLEGTNQTNQSDFARVEDGVLYPKLFSETADPYAAVGRKPLIRVQLLTADNKVVSTGWIRVEIVKEKTPAVDVDFNFGSFTHQCDDKAYTLTVEQMNVNIYNKVQLDRTAFNNAYTLQVVSAGNYGQGDGIVSLKTDNTNPTVTDLLSWNITEADMAKALRDNRGVLKTVVTYKSNEPASRGDVTVVFSATVNPIQAVTINNKIAEYWDSKKEYIRLNVKVPEKGDDNSANCTFVVDLDNVFVGNKPVINGASGYKYVFSDQNNNRSVRGLSGKSYTLSVKANGAELYANTELVAKLDVTTGEVTYQETTIAKDLLNIDTHSAVPNGGFFAIFNIKATTGDCDLELPITNGTFKGYFFRPIDVTAGEGKFKDAVDGGSTVNMLDLVAFNDWRDVKFGSKDNVNYFGYYGISDIKVDIENITTDLNGGNINTQLLKNVSSNLVVEQVATGSGITPEFGTVTYKNNGNAVGAFNLRLPVTVTYKWGTVKAYVTIPVEKTLGN